MFSWFKKKTQAKDTSELSELMHSMQDDLEGRPVKGSMSIPPTEPMASFTPHSGAGPAFRGEAPPRPAKEAPPENLPTSPFLDQGSQGSQAPNIPSQSAPQALNASGEVVAVPSPEIQPGAPFDPEVVLTTPPSSEITIPAAPTARPGFWHSPLAKYLFIGGAGAVSLAALAWGGYMFWQRSEEAAPSPVPAPPAEEVAPVPNSDIVPTQPMQRFSETAPNTISINIETVTPEELRQILLQTAQQVKEDKHSTAMAFTVRDQNLNPLAFTRFAYLFKLALPESLLSTLDEPFTLFVYSDGERPRLGLKLTVKDWAAFQTELSQSEKSLALAIAPLFLDITTAPKTNLAFRTGSSVGLSTRYVNLDPNLNLSVDYAVKDPHWYIGTSRNTLRAVLDAGERPSAASSGLPKKPAAAQTPPPAMLNGSTGNIVDIPTGS